MVFNHQKLIGIAAVALILCAAIFPAAQERAVTDEFRLYQNFHSKFLAKDRHVIVWLPSNYDKEVNKRYPVLYLQDGLTAFSNWRLDETATPLISGNEIEPLLIVFVANGGPIEARTEEYTPTRDASMNKGGKADDYGRMLVEELKPLIDREFRTLTDPDNTGLGGASFGALAALHLGLKYPETFGRLAVLSPSVWWDHGVIIREVKKLSTKPSQRIWLDVGTEEGQSVDATRQLRDALTEKGWVLNSDLSYLEAKGGRHEEKAFSSRAPLFLKFLFPRKGT